MDSVASRRFWRPRFRLATLFWLTLVAALAFAWRGDRQRSDDRLRRELEATRLDYEIRMAAIDRELTGVFWIHASTNVFGKRFSNPAGGHAGMNAQPPITGRAMTGGASARRVTRRTVSTRSLGFAPTMTMTRSGFTLEQAESNVTSRLASLLSDGFGAQRGVIPSAGSYREYILEHDFDETDPFSIVDHWPMFLEATALFAEQRDPTPEVETLAKIVAEPDSSSEFRLRAACGLAMFGQRTDEALAALVELLHGRDDDLLRARAALAIGSLGAKAESAFPKLEECLVLEVDRLIQPAVVLAMHLVRPNHDVPVADLKLMDADPAIACLVVDYLEQSDKGIQQAFLPQLRALLAAQDERLMAAGAFAISRSSPPGEAARIFREAFAAESNPARRGFLAGLCLAQKRLDEESAATRPSPSGR